MTFFDRKKFGKSFQKARKQRGYKSADAFVIAIEEQTDVKIQKDTLNRIEQGKQEPTLSQFMAMCKTAFGSVQPREVYAILHGCLDDEWKSDESKYLYWEYNAALFNMVDFFAKGASYVDSDVLPEHKPAGKKGGKPEDRVTFELFLDVLNMARWELGGDVPPYGGRWRPW